MATTIYIPDYIVRNADSSIDYDATSLKFKNDVLRYEEAETIESSTISDAVLSVLNEHKGVGIPLLALVDLTLKALNSQPENFSFLKERVCIFIKRNSSLVIKGKKKEVSIRV